MTQHHTGDEGTTHFDGDDCPNCAEVKALATLLAPDADQSRLSCWQCLEGHPLNPWVGKPCPVVVSNIHIDGTHGWGKDGYISARDIFIDPKACQCKCHESAARSCTNCVPCAG